MSVRTDPIDLWVFSRDSDAVRYLFRGLQEGLHWLRTYIAAVPTPRAEFQLL